MSSPHQAKRIVLIGIGFILLIVGIIIFIGGYNDSRLHGQSQASLQFEVGGLITGIVGILLLWRGYKLRDNKLSSE
ncbi:MAG TPA: hypothetical protein VH415_06595 [Nitrososphaeraceae archaeon]|jgi:uncharacterized membrane protein